MTYPGNKAKWQIHATGFTKIYDLFAGSGAWGMAALASNPYALLLGAEINPVQLAILRGQALCHVKLATQALAELKATFPLEWDGLGRIGVVCPESRRELGIAWERLVKRPWNEAIVSGVVTPEAIVAQLLALQCTINNKLACSSKGLNVAPSAGKIHRLKFLVLPKGVPGGFVSDFRDVSIDPEATTLVLIDPPYALPAAMRFSHSELMRCYPGHLPYSEGAMDLYILSVEKAISGKANQIRVANYWSESLDSWINYQAMIGGYDLVLIKRFKPKKSYKLQLVHGLRSAKPNLSELEEVEWVLTKKS